MTRWDIADVAVVGAGPAGAAAAIALARRNCKVVLVDNASEPRGWRAGETLLGDADGFLTALGVADWLEGSKQLESAAIASSWGSPDVAVTYAITNPHGGGWHIDRAAFERMLVDAAEAAGVQVWRATRATALERAGRSFELAGESREVHRRARAAFVVDASGTTRWAARRLGAVSTESPQRQIGLAARLVPSPTAEPWPPALLLEACETGWWYSVPVPDGHVIAVFVTDADLLPRPLKAEAAWRAALADSEHTRKRLDGYSPVAFRMDVCGTSRLSAPVGPGWAAIGDAAMVFDPMSSRGISKALAAGLEVAQALGEPPIGPDLVLAAYAQNCERQFAGYCRTLGSFYASETRWPESPFWQRRHRWTDSLTISSSQTPTAPEHHAHR